MEVNIPKSQVDLYYRYKRNVVECRFVTSHKGQTEILNLDLIAGQLNRDVKAIVKYLKKSLNINIIRFENVYRLPSTSVDTIEECIESFIKTFVLCKKCGNPETKNNEKNRCKACGYKNYFID